MSGVVGPRATSGRDHLLSVTLSDPTCVDGVCFNLFRSSAASFPHLQVGDVMRVHRCAIQVYAGNKVGGTVKEKAAQFVCYRGGHVPLNSQHTAPGNKPDSHALQGSKSLNSSVKLTSAASLTSDRLDTARTAAVC